MKELNKTLKLIKEMEAEFRTGLHDKWFERLINDTSRLFRYYLENREFNYDEYFSSDHIQHLMGWKRREYTKEKLKDVPFVKVGYIRYYHAKEVRKLVLKQMLNSNRFKIQITEA